MTHELKTFPHPFAAVVKGTKMFEFRCDDRTPGFRVGDRLVLREFHKDDGPPGAYTGRSLTVVVTYLLRGPDFGIPEGFVCMSIEQGN